MSGLKRHPRRRAFLRALTLSALGLPLLRLSRVLARRRMRPEDLSPIPWIGHC